MFRPEVDKTCLKSVVVKTKNCLSSSNQVYTQVHIHSVGLASEISTVIFIQKLFCIKKVDCIKQSSRLRYGLGHKPTSELASVSTELCCRNRCKLNKNLLYIILVLNHALSLSYIFLYSFYLRDLFVSILK